MEHENEIEVVTVNDNEEMPRAQAKELHNHATAGVLDTTAGVDVGNDIDPISPQ